MPGGEGLEVFFPKEPLTRLHGMGYMSVYPLCVAENPKLLLWEAAWDRRTCSYSSNCYKAVSSYAMCFVLCTMQSPFS